MLIWLNIQIASPASLISVIYACPRIIQVKFMSAPIIYLLPQVSIASRLCAKSTISLFIADHYPPFVLATCYIEVH